MRVESKQQLIDSIDETWLKLWESVDAIGLPNRDLRIQFDSVDASSVKDILAHLHGWHRLLLKWIGTEPDREIELPAKGFKWNETPELNQKIFEDWKDVEFSSVSRRLRLSHNRVLKFVKNLSETQLLTAGQFAWTKKHAISSYIAPNTTSHYKWAAKKIKRLQKQFAEC